MTRGIDWIPINPPDSNINLMSVCFSEKVGFVAVGRNTNGNSILTSPDGETWTERYSPSTGYLRCVAYANSKFVAISSTGDIITSKNGKTWELKASGIMSDMYSVAYGNGRWVVVGLRFSVAISFDNGETWNTYPHSIRDLRCIIWSNIANAFIAVTERNGIYKTITWSNDGITWEEQHAPGELSPLGANSICEGSDKIVIVTRPGGTGYTTSKSAYSTDGISWEVGLWSYGVLGIGEWYSVCVGEDEYGSEQYVAVGDTGDLATSPNGIVFTRREITNATNKLFTCVCYAEGLYVAVTTSGIIYISGVFTGSIDDDDEDEEDIEIKNIRLRKVVHKTLNDIILIDNAPNSPNPTKYKHCTILNTPYNKYIIYFDYGVLQYNTDTNHLYATLGDFCAAQNYLVGSSWANWSDFAYHSGLFIILLSPTNPMIQSTINIYDQNDNVYYNAVKFVPQRHRKVISNTNPNNFNSYIAPNIPPAYNPTIHPYWVRCLVPSGLGSAEVFACSKKPDAVKRLSDNALIFNVNYLQDNQTVIYVFDSDKVWELWQVLNQDSMPSGFYPYYETLTGNYALFDENGETVFSPFSFKCLRLHKYVSN